MIKSIGVLTSGGDAPGMNACVRAIVRTCVANGIKAYGIRRGYRGLINDEVEELTARSVSDTLQRGGTILQTARCPEFKEEAGVQKAVDTCKKLGIDAIVVIGGDGSFRGARDLCLHGIPTVGIPGTIDNDISCTEYTIGFDTCLNTVIEAVDRLRDTSSSHERCSVVEVMGNHAGYIAVNTAISCGAEVCLIPEKEWDLQKDVLDVIVAGRERGKQHNLVIVAEGAGKGMEIAKAISEHIGHDTRATILGHIQRGGSPTAHDRVVASKMGYYAVKMLMEGKSNRVVCSKDNHITDIDILEGLAMQKTVDDKVIELAKTLAV